MTSQRRFARLMITPMLAVASSLLSVQAQNSPTATVPSAPSYSPGLFDALRPGSGPEEVTEPFSSSFGTSLGASSSPATSTAETVAAPVETTSPSLYRNPSIVSGRPHDPLAARHKPQSKIGISVRSSVEYNDNVFIDRDNKQDDVVVVIAPTLAVNTGDFRNQRAAYLSAAYTATASAYVNNTTDETLDHQMIVEGQLKKRKVTVPFQVNLARETGAFVDIGGRDTAQRYGGRVGLDYEASSKVSLGLSGEYVATDYELFSDFSQSIAEAYVNYQVTAKTSLGVAYRYSESETDGAPSQKYQAGLVRLRTAPTKRLSAVAEAGPAFSKLENGDRTDLVYRASVTYQPSTRRRFAIEAIRQPSTSSFTVGSGVINNGIQLSYEQALGNRTRMRATGGYQHQDYFAATEGVETDRRDDYIAFSALLAYDIDAHWSAELFYSYNDNDSSIQEIGFDNQRVGLGLNWSY